MRGRPIIDAIRRMVLDADCFREFSVDVAKALEWECSEDEAMRNCRKYFNAQRYRHLPAEAIPIAIRVSKLDYVTPLLLRELVAAEMAGEEFERPGMLKVQPGRRGLRETG